MIPLERLLDGLDVAVEPFVLCFIRRDWSLDCGRIDAPTVHYTLSGCGVLELAGGATLPFTAHSFIILPPRLRAWIVPEGGARHTVTAGARCDPLPEEWTKIEAGAGDPDIVVACGRIRATYQGSIGLFDRLPEPLVETFAADDPIRRSFEELLDEIAARRPGSRAMAETLLRRCLILLLRRYCERGECRLAWLAALDDARLGRAVTAMLERPEHPFTLGRLAEVAGMSRSVFAVRFADAFDQSPIGFLKRLRLARAAQLLARTDLPVKTVAARVGYSSRSSFTRAFHASQGVGPTAFRAAARAPAPGPSRRASAAAGEQEAAPAPN